MLDIWNVSIDNESTIKGSLPNIHINTNTNIKNKNFAPLNKVIS